MRHISRTQPKPTQSQFENFSRDTVHFCRVVVWYGVNKIIIYFPKYPFRQVVVLLFILSFKSSGRKIAIARQGIESILSPKQQRRPLPSLLSLSFYCGYTVQCIQADLVLGCVLAHSVPDLKDGVVVGVGDGDPAQAFMHVIYSIQSWAQ